MKVTTERAPNAQAVLEIEVEPERVERSMDRAYRKMVGRYRIPGFRPGKAPRVMFERYVGRQTLLREALETLVPEVYEEAVKQESLDPIGDPELAIPTMEPLTIKATVPLRPTVELGDYRSLRLERPPVEVDEEKVNASLEELRRRYATVEPVERPVQAGDVVRLDLRATEGERELINEKDIDLRLTDEGTRGLPGLLEQLSGAEKGREYEYTVQVPDDEANGELAGKSVTYQVAISEVKEERLPELDDAFASEVGEGFPSLAVLRERVESDLRKRAEEEAERDYERRIIGTLIEQATLAYPPVMVESEIDHIINEQFGGMNRATLQSLLQRSGRKLEDFREQFREAAEERVKRTLVLTRVAEEEGLSVEPTEVDDEINRMVEASTQSGDELRTLFSSDAGRDVLRRRLLTDRVVARLRDIAEGKEVPPRPEKPATPAEPTAAASAEGEPAAEAENESVTEPSGSDQPEAQR